MSTTIPELKHAHTASEPTTPVDDKVPSLNDSKNDTVVEDGQSQIEIEPRSKGVIEMEALRERINVKYLCLLYGTFALLAYVLSLSESRCSGVVCQSGYKTDCQTNIPRVISSMSPCQSRSRCTLYERPSVQSRPSFKPSLSHRSPNSPMRSVESMPILAVFSFTFSGTLSYQHPPTSTCMLSVTRSTSSVSPACFYCRTSSSRTFPVYEVDSFGLSSPRSRARSTFGSVETLSAVSSVKEPV